MSRQLIVVDVETTGLHANARVLEVAAVNVETREEFRFVPWIDNDAIKWAEPKALQINRYFERGVFDDMLDQDDTKAAYEKLRTWLDGNTLGGSNPTFDAAKIVGPVGGQVWHHRLADLAAYAAGALGLPPAELPGMEKVCTLLDVTNFEPHSALGDAFATAECFRKLTLLRGSK